jgi:hypothetical protein
LLYAFSILKPQIHIKSGKVKMVGMSGMSGPTMVLAEKLRTTPEYNTALNEYEVI